MDTPYFYTVPETAVILGVSQDAIRQRIRLNTLTHEKTGGRYVVPAHVVHMEQLAKARKQMAKAKIAN